MSWLSDIFGLAGGNTTVRQALQEGGVVIDLRTAGITRVYNGGDWQSLWRTIKER